MPVEGVVKSKEKLIYDSIFLSRKKNEHSRKGLEEENKPEVHTFDAR